jgi:hypothetical protein
MKKSILLIFTLVGIIYLQSCQYAWLEEPPAPPLPDTVSYSADIQPIWDKSCNSTGCHAPGGFSPDLTSANSYSQLWADGLVDTAIPANSVIYQKIAVGSMKFYAKPGDAELVLKWIEDGALNN